MEVLKTPDGYTIDGEPVPRVTEIIRAAGLMGDMAYASDDAMARGRYIHAVLEHADRGDLAEAEVEPWARGYLNAWRTFRSNMDYSVTGIEVVVGSKLDGYAGTCDRLGRWSHASSVILVEIKTGMMHPWHLVQAAAYGTAAGVQRCAVVYLSDTGRNRLVNLVAVQHFEPFRSALNLWHWRKRYGIE